MSTERKPLHHLYHRAGHDTEVEAAAFILPRLNRLQELVLRFAAEVYPAGFTLRDLTANFSAQDGSTWRTRCSELVSKGLIEETDRRITYPPKKHRHIVWRWIPNPRPGANGRKPKPQQMDMFK